MRPILTLEVMGGESEMVVKKLLYFLTTLVAILFLLMGCGKAREEKAVEAPAPAPAPAPASTPEKPAEALRRIPKVDEKLRKTFEVTVKRGVSIQEKKISPKGEVPKGEPVYNVEVTPKKLQDPLVLIPGKETSVIFYIGPQSEESLTKSLPPVPMITGYKGDELELTVTLNCSLCEKDTYQQDQIAYRPKDRKSSKARFKIVPSSAIVSKSQGMGDLIFTVDNRGNVLDRIRVRAFVGDPTPEGLAAYVSPAKVPVETSPVGEGRFPDIIILVGFAGRDGKIPIVIRPRLEGLQKVFLDEFGDGHGSGPDMAWEFKSGVTKADVDGLVLEIYKAFRTIMEQNKTYLDEYKRLGSDVTLERGAAGLEFSNKDCEMMLDNLRGQGQNLYWRIFREGAAVNLGKAMDFIDNLPPGPPLRVTIRSEDIYAPWQILYPFKKDSDNKGKTDPRKFWGFRYEMGITHEGDSRQGRQRNLVPLPKPDEIAFAGWRGSKPKDEVADRVRMLAEHIKSKTGATVEPSYEKKKFIDKLERKAPDIRFIFAYGHATSGTVLDEKRPIISGVEWLPAHFKFSEKDLLTPGDFDDLAKKVDLKAQPIVILDACETGTFGINAMNNNGFVGALTRAGAGAVIVTESPVLANFAYHFGMNLIDELFDEKVDVSQAMLNVRLKHLIEWENPLGLVYTLYGNPAARIKAQ